MPTLCGKLSELAQQRLRQITFRSRSRCGTAHTHSKSTTWVFSPLTTVNKEHDSPTSGSLTFTVEFKAVLILLQLCSSRLYWRPTPSVTMCGRDTGTRQINPSWPQAHNGVLLRTSTLVMCWTPMDVFKEPETSLTIWRWAGFTQWSFMVLHQKNPPDPKKHFIIWK